MSNLNFGMNILPKTTNTYTLGSNEYKWNIFANQINGVNVQSIINGSGSGSGVDVQINETSIVSDGVANIPIANQNTYGVIQVSDSNLTFGVILDQGLLKTSPAGVANIKAGNASRMPIVPAHQHEAVYYGLSKLAGVDLASGNDTVGVYPATAKNAIQSMIGVENAVTFTENISGTVVTINGEPNTKYKCNEVTALTINAPSAGTIDVWFTSGQTPTTLTVTNVQFPEWFDIENLESDTVYEIVITNGFGGVASWPAPIIT